MFERERFPVGNPVLGRLGVHCVRDIDRVQGHFIKDHHGLRDVLRLTLDEADGPHTYFLKRNRVGRLKNTLGSIFRHGYPMTEAEIEAENLARAWQMGVYVCRPVAVGGIVAGLKEKASFLLTDAAPGVPMDDWLAAKPARVQVLAVLQRLAHIVRQFHNARLGLPTLMARHVFVEFHGDQPTLTLIDLDHYEHPLFGRHRQAARDLARLNLSVPDNVLNRADRLRFLRWYDGRIDRRLITKLQRRESVLRGRLGRRSRRESKHEKSQRTGPAIV